MCAFNLLKDEACCPMCYKAIKPITCGFQRCAWMYDGRKLGKDGVAGLQLSMAGEQDQHIASFASPFLQLPCASCNCPAQPH